MFSKFQSCENVIRMRKSCLWSIQMRCCGHLIRLPQRTRMIYRQVLMLLKDYHDYASLGICNTTSVKTKFVENFETHLFSVVKLWRSYLPWIDSSVRCSRVMLKQNSVFQVNILSRVVISILGFVKSTLNAMRDLQKCATYDCELCN